MLNNRWIRDGVRPLVLAAMVGAIALSLVGLVRFFFPAWRGTYLVGLFALVALEAHYSHRLLDESGLRGQERLRFRFFELATLWIAVKLTSLTSQGQPFDVTGWFADPGSFLLDAESWIVFVLVLLVWDRMSQTAADFDVIDGPQDIPVENMALHQRHADEVAYLLSRRGSHEAMQDLTGRFLQGGAVLLVVAGLSRVGVMELLNTARPPVRGLVLNVLFYFLTGLVLLGLTRYANLRRRWQVERIHIADEVAGRWVLGVLALVGLATLVAFVLPSSYSMGLLTVVGVVLDRIFVFVSFLALFLMFLLIYPFAWLAWLMLRLLGGEPSRPAFNPPAPPPELATPPPLESPAGWFEVLRSLLYWLVILGVVAVVLRAYLRDHPHLLDSLRSTGWARWLARVWGALWRRLRGFSATATAQLRRLVPRSLAGVGRGQRDFGWSRPRARTPRDQVLAAYRSVLRHAREQGHPRRRSETPYEYDDSLSPHLPTAHEAWDHLTDAFVEARYSEHPIDEEVAAHARRDWEQVRDALQRRESPPDEAETPGEA